jgi:hypothetical protein
MVMKKIFTLILMVSILVSCSDWKYSNGVKRQKRTYVYSNPTSTSESEISTENEKAVSVIDEEITTKNQKFESVESALESQPETTENNEAQIILVNTKKLENDEDSIKPVSQLMVNQAIEAEEEGEKSRNLGLAGLILQIILFPGIAGLVLSIISFRNGTSSLKADYNTPKGLKMARTGVVLSSIGIGIFVLRLLVIILVILSFVL